MSKTASRTTHGDILGAIGRSLHASHLEISEWGTPTDVLLRCGVAIMETVHVFVYLLLGDETANQ
jgi:hypothetical protein